MLRRRNVAAAPSAGEPSTAARLFDHAVRAGGPAAGETLWGLREGARADALVADAGDPALAGILAQRLLDAIVFSSPARAWPDVMVGGWWVIRDGVHPWRSGIAGRFAEATGAIWSDR